MSEERLRIVDKVKLLVIEKFEAGIFTSQELKREWEGRYRNDEFEGRVLLSDYCVNTISGYPTDRVAPAVSRPEDRFLFWIEKGKYRIYDPQRDGRWRREVDRMIQI